MQVKVLLDQIDALKQRISDILCERAFFGLDSVENKTPVLENLESRSVVELDEHFHYCVQYYDELVTKLKQEKLRSPLYQRSLGINAVLVNLGVGISNFHVNDVDKTAVEQMFSMCVDRIILLEQQVLDTVMQSRFSVSNRACTSCSSCSQFLDEINKLIVEIQRLEAFKGSQKTLPIPDARHYLYSER